MISTIYRKKLFAKLFSLGLLFLFAGTLAESFDLFAKNDFLIFGSISFFSIGVTLCLVSLLFLLIEWVMLPFGTQTKRIKLYQGVGNLLAFVMLAGGWLFKEQSTHRFADIASLTISSIGFVIAIIFGWLGSEIADYISRKKIKLENIRGGKFLSANNKSRGKSAEKKAPAFPNAVTNSSGRIPTV